MRKLLLPLLLSFFLSVEAQQSSGLRIGIEFGTFEMSGKIDDRWEFRHMKSHNSFSESYYGSENVTGMGEMRYAALKSELSIWGNRITLASGLKYTHVDEQISPVTDSRLYLYHPSTQGIELFRIRGMNESLGYLSVPLEADILLWGRLSNWQTYVKGGIEVGTKIHGKTSLDFVSKEMDKYEKEILLAAGKAPSNLFVNAYGSIGLRLILNNGIRLAGEVSFPGSVLSKNNFSLLSTKSYSGVRFMISTPINLFSNK